MELWAKAEKQNNFPPVILPNALARKLVNMVALISNRLLYRDDFGATMICSAPTMDPRRKQMGKSIQRPPNAKGATAALAKNEDAKPRMELILRRHYCGDL